MNAERLHAVVAALNQELNQRSSVRVFDGAVNALQAVVSSSNANTQSNLASALANLYQSLTDTPSDSFSPSWRQILKDIGAEDLFGRSLKDKVEAILAKNQITLAVALEEIGTIQTRLNEFKDALANAKSSFDKFGIPDEKLAPGECEIGILIPRGAVDNKLVELADEMKELASIIDTFSEVATGSPEEMAVKTISSSDFLVFLDAKLALAACLAVSIEKIVGLYKQILEIRKLHQELLKQGVPEEATKRIEEHANSIMETGIKVASVEIVAQFYTGNDAGRKNELTTAVRVRMNQIANKIDRGFNLEVRCGPLPEEEEPNEEQQQKKAKHVAIIREATPKMQFMNLGGEPILQLPEQAEAPDGTATEPTKTRAKRRIRTKPD